MRFSRDKITFDLILSRVAWESREKRATYAWRTRPVCYGTLIYYLQSLCGNFSDNLKIIATEGFSLQNLSLVFL